MTAARSACRGVFGTNVPPSRSGIHEVDCLNSRAALYSCAGTPPAPPYALNEVGGRPYARRCAGEPHRAPKGRPQACLRNDGNRPVHRRGALLRGVAEGSTRRGAAPVSWRFGHLEGVEKAGIEAGGHHERERADGRHPVPERLFRLLRHGRAGSFLGTASSLCVCVCVWVWVAFVICFFLKWGTVAGEWWGRVVRLVGQVKDGLKKN